ncbi:MAG: hypothetical protein C6P36_09415 [Geobacillus sp.]|nr:MAG: hypothetical protein C6P36_09415 [Geobacillus sp.]
MAYQPKSYRKFLAGSVSAALVATAVGPVVANAASFSDVNPNDSHAANINALVELGYIKGFADGTFKPYQSITRGQVAKIFARILTDQGFQAPDKIEQVFDDVPLDAKDQELVKAAAIVKAAGVMTGSQGKLNPAQNITREQMAKVLVEAFDLTKPADFTSKITDLDKADPSFRDYIQTLEANGVTVVTEYRPKDSVTRAAFASFVKRALDVSSVVTADDITAVKFVDENTLEVTFNGELKEVKKEDFAIEGVEIDSVSIKAAASAESKTTVVVIKTKTKLEEGKTYTISYKGKTTDKAKVEVPVVTPKVESVSAINAKKIVVKFNKEVNKTDAETPSNYTFVGLPGSTTWTPSLQEDGKTVVLTLSNAIPNDTTFVATVSEIATKADANVKTAKYTTILTFSDKVAPTVTGVTYPRAGVAELNFSEELSTIGTVQVYEGTSVSTDVTPATFTPGDSKLVLTGLKPNKEYTVEIVGAKDQSGNLISAPIELTIKNTITDTVAPQVTSVTTSGLDTIKVQFSEGLDTIAPNTYANIYIDGTQVNGATQSFDPQTNTLTITKSGLATAGVRSVKIDGFKDYAGNVGVTFTKVVPFSNAAPSIVKTEVKQQGNDTFVVVTFDKAPVLTNLQTDSNSSEPGVYTLSYVTPDNVEKTTTIDATDISLDTTDSNAPKVLFKVTGKEAGSYTLVIPKDNITDGTTAASADATIKFNLTSTVDTTKPVVQNVFLPGSDASSVGGPSSVPLNTVYVKYSKSMSASALNTANYTIDGVNVFDSAVFVGDKTLVKLTLKDGAIKVSGERNFAISNAVTGENNVAIDKYTQIVNVKENVKPTFVSAQLIDDKSIELTFSESIKDSTLTPSDFTVAIDGATVALDSSTPVDTGSAADDNKVILKLASAIDTTQFTKTITVKLGKDTTLTDLNGNAAVGDVVVNVAK